MAHKGLDLPKRFTNLLLGVNVIDFVINRSIGVSQAPKVHDALIKVFKFIRYV